MNLQAGNVLTSGSTDLTIDLLLREVGLYVILHVILPPHRLLTGITLVHHHRPQLVPYLRHVAVKSTSPSASVIDHGEIVLRGLVHICVVVHVIELVLGHTRHCTNIYG